MYKSHFRLNWKSNGASSNKAVEELEWNFKFVDNMLKVLLNMNTSLKNINLN